MKLVEINWHPTNRTLRQFGIACLLALPLIGWLAAANGTVISSLAAAGLACAVLGFVFPQVLRPVFVAVSLITAPIGMVMGEGAMLLMYYGVFAPLGLWFRLIGRDTLARKARVAEFNVLASQTPTLINSAILSPVLNTRLTTTTA